METAARHQNANFVYDPFVVGYDLTFWKPLTGTPTVVSNKLNLNAAEIATYSYYKYAEAIFRLLVPTAPTSGDARSWGFKVPALGAAANRIEFDITGAVFSVKAYDQKGNILLNRTITWNVAWSNAVVDYAIRWAEGSIVFAVNDVIVAKWTVPAAANRHQLRHAASLHIANANADDMPLSALLVNEIHSLT